MLNSQCLRLRSLRSRRKVWSRQQHHASIHLRSFRQRGSAAGVITNSSGVIVANNLYDAFSATRFTSGTAATPWRNGDHYQAEEGMIANCIINLDRDLQLSPQNCGQQKKQRSQVKRKSEIATIKSWMIVEFITILFVTGIQPSSDGVM